MMNKAFIATLVAGLSTTPDAFAQSIAAPPAAAQPGPTVAYARMARACTVDARRFCPDISGVQTHNLAICLRPYRNNLSLGCRSALRATSASRMTSP